MKFLLFILLSFGSVTNLLNHPYVTIYFVKASGGTGSGLDDANAWSYAKLNSVALSPGDSVVFKRGDTFYGTWTTDAGSSGSPVKYGAYGTGANPVISGLSTLTSWTLSSGNIYYATVADTLLNVVLYDGVIKGRGRFPKTGYNLVTSHTVGGTSTTTASITSTSVGVLPFDPTGAEVVIRKIRQVMDRHLITSRVSNTLNLGGAYYGNNAAYIVGDGMGWFVQNSLSILQQTSVIDGDWYFDRTTSRLYMYFANGNPASHVVKASTVDRLTAFSSGKNYINVSNIDFEGANNECVFMSGGAHDINFYSCNFRNSMSGAIMNDVTAINYYNGSVTGMLDFGIKGTGSPIGVTFVKIDGTTFNNVFQIAGAGGSGDGKGEAIGLFGTDNTARNCEVQYAGFHGIRIFGNRSTIEQNFIHDFGNVKDDAGGIYTFGNTGETLVDFVVRDNIVLNAIGAQAGGEAFGKTYPMTAAIYLDDMNGAKVYRNTFAFGGWVGLYNYGDADRDSIDNNTFYAFDQSQVHLSNYQNTYLRNMYFARNKMIAKSATAYTMEVVMQNLSGNDTVSLFGTMNNNIYARPVDDNQTISVYKYPTGSFTTTLAGWKTYSSQDAASTKSLVTISDTSLFRFDYNYSASPVSVSLPGIYKDVNNTSYNGLISVPAYGGAVTIYNSALPSAGSLIIRGRKIVTQ